MSTINLKVKWPKVSSDLGSNIVKLEVFLKELGLAKDKFHARLGQLRKEIKKNRDPVLVQDLSNRYTDPELSLYLKSYFFIYRQFISTVFRAVYQVEGKMKKQNTMPDVSKNHEFKKFIKKLMNGEYDDAFDKEVINTLKKYAPVLIASRYVRNHMKKSGLFPILLEGDGKLKIVVYIHEQDASMELMLEKMGKKDKDKMIIEPEFLDSCHSFAEEIEKKMNFLYSNLP